MNKMIFMAFSLLAFSSVSHAAITGSWTGTLSFENQACQPVTIEVSRQNNELSIKAAGDQFIQCGNQGFMLNESYGIQGADLYKYEIKMGSISDTDIVGKERVYDVNGYWRFWDFIQLHQNSDGTLQVQLNFGDEDTLSGTLKK